MVDHPVERCPLCFDRLERADGFPEEPSYPPLLKQAEQYNLIKRTLLMLSFTVALVCVTINFFASPQNWWSLIVLGNILYMWIAIGTMVRKRSKLGYNILMQAISLSAVLILIDYRTGWRGWAVNYVFPFLLMTAILSITVVIIVRRVDSSHFILYLFLMALIGFLPIALWAVGWAEVLWPALVSALYSALSIIGMFIFADRSTKQELKKRFHL